MSVSPARYNGNRVIDVATVKKRVASAKQPMMSNGIVYTRPDVIIRVASTAETALKIGFAAFFHTMGYAERKNVVMSRLVTRRGRHTPGLTRHTHDNYSKIPGGEIDQNAFSSGDVQTIHLDTTVLNDRFQTTAASSPVGVQARVLVRLSAERSSSPKRLAPFAPSRSIHPCCARCWGGREGRGREGGGSWGSSSISKSSSARGPPAQSPPPPTR